METKGMKYLERLMVGAGSLMCLWAAAVLIGGLRQANWQVTELARQYLIATGMIQPIHTLVDFYSHIKGIEYIICLAFFVAFPIFFRLVERKKSPPVRTTAKVKKGH